jgi:membrane protein required for colicin V production
MLSAESNRTISTFVFSLRQDILPPARSFATADDDRTDDFASSKDATEMWYDVCMLAILAYTTIRGAAKGMAWQLAAIAALILCFVFATPLSLVVAPTIPLDPPLNRWVAMLGIYLAFSFACFSIARMLRSWLEALKFEEYDRHLGAIFGFLKGATLCLVITFFAVCLSETAREHILETRAGRISGQILDQLAVVMPAELDKVLSPYLRHFDDEPTLAIDAGQDREGDHPLPGDTSFDDRYSDDFRGTRRPPIDAPDRDAEDDSPLGRVLDAAVDKIENRIKERMHEAVEDVLTPGRSADRPSSPQATTSQPAATGESVTALIASISELLSNRPDHQAERQTELGALLRGIPAGPAAAALRDWNVDLLGTGTDPDPDTDLTTPLDYRLIRQLHAAGVPMTSLPRPIRERLEEAAAE